MRLTLRTLLAYLDDTLSPEEASQIGTQVSEAPFARQLVEKIRKVTRQRRLTVPARNGHEAVDPNTVAAYLDNELDHEGVAAYEKLCLESDVNLAEAAACHQILSLIRNKAKVPTEARYRMYRLVRGREAARTAYAQGTQAGLGPDHPDDHAPPWDRGDEAPGSVIDRVGPPLLAAALIAVLAVVGWLNLRESRTLANGRPRVEPELVGGSPPEGGPPDAMAPAVPVEAPTEPPLGPERPEPEAEAVAGTDEAEADGGPEVVEAPDAGRTRPADESRPAPALSAGVVGRVAEAGGIVVRAGEGPGTWTRLETDDELRDGDRIVCLAPYRATLQVGTAEVVLVSQVELRLAKAVDDEAARFELIEGSVALESSDAARPVAVLFDGRAVAIDPPPGRPIGLSALGVRPPGQQAGRPVLTISVPAGEATVQLDAVGDTEPPPAETLKGPLLASIDAVQGFAGSEVAMARPWVTDPTPAPAEVQAGEAFGTLLQDRSGHLELALLEGTEDERTEVQELSVAALGAIGEYDQVADVLDRPDAPRLRAAALGALSRGLARGPDTAEEVLAMIDRYAESPAVARALRRLLIGYGGPEAPGPEVFTELVGDLAAPNPSVRQLALNWLMGLTNRDAMGYDPDRPEGEGLEAWRDLLKANRLRATAPATR